MNPFTIICWSTLSIRARRNSAESGCRRCCLKGIHKKIEAWRREQSIRRTMERRPELMEGAVLTKAESAYADGLKRGMEKAARASYRVLSFDLFQTLADVNARIPRDLEGNPGGALHRTPCQNGSGGGCERLRKAPAGFVQEKEIFWTWRRCICAVQRRCSVLPGLEERKFGVSREQMAEVILKNHSQAPVYEDVVSVLKKLGERYRLILSSDASPLMQRESLRDLRKRASHLSRSFSLTSFISAREDRTEPFSIRL